MLLAVVYSWFPWYFNFFIVVYVAIVLMLARRAYHIAFCGAAVDDDADCARNIVARVATSAQRSWLKLLFKLAVLNYIGGSLFFWIPEMFIICVPNGYVQLHALFHLTSAIGAYSFIVFATLFHYIVFVNGSAHISSVFIGVDTISILPLYVCHINEKPMDTAHKD
jgi:hypothetical protein